MTTVSHIVERVKTGDRIKFHQGFYGEETVVLTRGRLFRRKSRFDVSPEQIVEIKRALWPGRRSHSVDTSHS